MALERNKPLKPGKPLKRTTELKSKTGLTTKKSLAGGKALKHRSERMDAIYVERRKLVRRILRERPNCEAQWDSGCTQHSTDVHELVARSVGGNIIGGEEDEYLSVCRYCHDEITGDPDGAHERGLIKWSWEK